MAEFRKIINANMRTLCKFTSATAMFLDRCCESNMITGYERDKLSAVSEGYERNRAFYDVVLRKDVETFLKLIKIMEEEDTRQSTDVLNILNNPSNSITSIPGSSRQLQKRHVKRKNSDSESKNIWFEVGEPVTSFVGREKDLENLHRYIMRNCELDVSLVTVISQLTSLSGLGGIGKTTLARKYARTYANYFDQNVIWINGETSSSMEESFIRLTEEIIQAKNEKIEIAIDKIYKYLEDRKYLLVFDNVEAFVGPNGVQRYLPRNLGVDANRPYILLTSRNSRILQTCVCRVLELGVLREQDSVSFIKQQLKFDNEESHNVELIQKLVKKMEYLPLALQQAVAYIRNLQEEIELSDETGTDPIEEYLKLFDEDSTSILVLGYDFASDTGDDYKFTVLTTWNITISKIKILEYGELAFEFMKLVAYFEPDDIRCSTFFKIFEKRKIESATNLLKIFCMIEKSGGVISVHRLVQHVIRIQSEHEKYKLLRLSLEEIVPNELPKSGTFRQHITSIWKYSLEYPELVSEFSRVGFGLSDTCSDEEMYDRYSTYKNMAVHTKWHGLELLAYHVGKYNYKVDIEYRVKMVEELESQVPNAVSGWKNSLQNGTLANWNIYRMECFAFNIKTIEGLSLELYKSASEIHQINFECYKLEKYPLERVYSVGILKELSKLERQDKYMAALNEILSLTFKSDEYKARHKATFENVITELLEEFKYAEISPSPTLRSLLVEQVCGLIQRINNLKDESDSTNRKVDEQVVILIVLIQRLMVLKEGYQELLKYSKDLSKTYALFINFNDVWYCHTKNKTEERLDFLFEFVITALSSRCRDTNESASMEMVEICISIWKSTHQRSAGNNSRKLLEFVHAHMGMKGIELICGPGSSVLSTEENCFRQIEKIDSLALQLIDMGKGYEEGIVRTSFMEESLKICEFVSKFIGDAHAFTLDTGKISIYVSNRINFIYASLELNQIKVVLKYSDQLCTFVCTSSRTNLSHLFEYHLKKLEKLGTAILFKVNQGDSQISTPTHDLTHAAIKIYKCSAWACTMNNDKAMNTQLNESFNLEPIIKCFVQFSRVDEITNLSKEIRSRPYGFQLESFTFNFAYNLIKFGKHSDIQSVAFEEARNIYTNYLKVKGRPGLFSRLTEQINEILSVTMELKMEGALKCLDYICQNRDKHKLMPTNSELQELSDTLIEEAKNDGSMLKYVQLIKKIKNTFYCIFKYYYLDNIIEHVALTAFDSNVLVKCYIELEDLEGMQQFSRELKKTHPAAKANEQLHWLVLENFASNLRDQVSGTGNFKFREEFLREADSISELVEKHGKT